MNMTLPFLPPFPVAALRFLYSVGLNPVTLFARGSVNAAQ
jgi:hypothetical protein